MTLEGSYQHVQGSCLSSPITSPQSLKISPRPLPSAALRHHQKGCFSLLSPAALPFFFFFFSFNLVSSHSALYFVDQLNR